MSQSELVVITGITGYLGAATLLEFLQSAPPQFRIRGTVRDKTNEAKLKPVRDGVGEALFSKVELVDADLLDADSLDKALAGAAYVVHTASPFHFNGGCVDPAVKGTLAVMEACAKHKVKRVVMTSSVAAILSLAAADKEKRGHSTPYDETCWSNPERPEGLGDYPTSKTLAEKAAWGFVRSRGPSFDLVVINPTFIMGPSPCCGDGTSEGFLLSILNGSKDKVPRARGGFVDVRDCARAHLYGVTKPSAGGHRFILYNKNCRHPDIYEILAKFNRHGAKVPTELADGDDAIQEDFVDNTKSKDVLGIEYYSIESTFTDMAQSLFDRGFIK